MKVTFSALVLLLGVAFSAEAVLIEIVPASSTVSVGDFFDVELEISELGDGVAPSLGFYDIDVTFNPTIVSPTMVSFGSELSFLFPSIQIDTPVIGSVNLFGLSLDSVADLNLLQAPRFTIATLSFEAIAPGQHPIAARVNDLGDAPGAPLDFRTTDARVTVERDGQQISEPHGMLLLMVGVAALRRVRGRTPSRKKLRIL